MTADVNQTTVDITGSLQCLVKSMVDHPEQVSLVSCATPEVTVLTLNVAPSDVGKVIGKQGRTARSLRTILSAAGMTAHHRYALDIVENGKTAAKEPQP